MSLYNRKYSLTGALSIILLFMIACSDGHMVDRKLEDALALAGSNRPQLEATNFIVVISNGDGTGHAVNGWRVADFVEGSDSNHLHFFYQDYQNNTYNRYYLDYQIIKIFICE